MKNVIKSLVLIAAVTAAGVASADNTTDATDTTKSAADYVYPLQGGVDYNAKDLRWKEVHENDVRSENLGKN